MSSGSPCGTAAVPAGWRSARVQPQHVIPKRITAPFITRYAASSACCGFAGHTGSQCQPSRGGTGCLTQFGTTCHGLC